MHPVRKKYLILTVVMVGLPLLVLVEERLRGEWLLARCRHRLIARGAKLTVAEVTPPLPEGTNVLLLSPDQANSLFNIGGLVGTVAPGIARDFSPGKAVVSWQRDRWFDSQGRVHTWADYRQAASGPRANLPELRYKLTNQVIRVVLDYGQGETLPLSHLSGLKACVAELCQAAVYDLHRGDLAGALANLHAAASLEEVLEPEVLVLNQLVRMALAAIARRAVWEALQADGWTDAQLAFLQADWESVQFTPAMIAALEMERAIDLSYFPGGPLFRRKAIREFAGGSLSGTPQPGRRFGTRMPVLADVVEPACLMVKVELWRQVWAPFDERLLIQGMQEVIDLARGACAQNALGSLANFEEHGTNRFGAPLLVTRFEEVSRSRLGSMLSELFLDWIHEPLSRAAQADAWNRVMVTAIALKRFHLKHGRWPGSLQALVPEFLLDVPLDCMDGRPLRYRLREDGTFLLYSVGKDGVDQGGALGPERPGPHRWDRGQDFVWPWPATPEEVAATEAARSARGSEAGPE